MDPVIAIEMKGITKTFGSVKANEDVNLTVKTGRGTRFARRKRCREKHTGEYAVWDLSSG